MESSESVTINNVAHLSVQNDTKTSNTVNQIRSTALERSVIEYLGLIQSDGILTSPFTSEVVQNNYMEGSGSVTINNVAHPKHPEEEETSPNRNHIITGKHNSRQISSLFPNRGN